MNNINLSGRRALITGASSGFGEHWGQLLSSAGAKVALAARRKEKLDALASAIGEAALPPVSMARVWRMTFPLKKSRKRWRSICKGRS